MATFSSELEEALISFANEAINQRADFEVLGQMPNKRGIEMLDDAKAVIKLAVEKYIIREDNEYNRDMPIPDPFALPQDYANKLRAYQRKALRGDK